MRAPELGIQPFSTNLALLCLLVRLTPISDPSMRPVPLNKAELELLNEFNAAEQKMDAGSLHFPPPILLCLCLTLFPIRHTGKAEAPEDLVDPKLLLKLTRTYIEQEPALPPVPPEGDAVAARNVNGEAAHGQEDFDKQDETDSRSKPK
jgi:hypothetical protein